MLVLHEPNPALKDDAGLDDCAIELILNPLETTAFAIPRFT